jgi:hypothetical protein
MAIAAPVARLYLAFAGASVIACGCNTSPEAVAVPRYNPASFAQALLERCDSDSGGTISQQEAAKAPALRADWARYDTNGDSVISPDELAARAQMWADRGDGLVSIRCVVKQEGRQLGDVTVKLIPDESLEDIIQPAESVTHESRASSLSIPPELKSEAHKKFAGMQYGLYRVEVSHPDYNLVPADDSAGCDIGPEDQASSVVIKVKRP